MTKKSEVRKTHSEQQTESLSKHGLENDHK